MGGREASAEARTWPNRGAMVLAADASHFYANMEEGRPYPVVFHIGEMVEGWRRLAELADSPDLVIPGHDPPVLARHTPAAAGLEGWIARLDLDPPA
ncbi:hypothetical protein HRbin39_00345 [bacterium HR39]|nr:hypothetical protein HRbin39_00345 [bacterium HR39]